MRLSGMLAGPKAQVPKLQCRLLGPVRLQRYDFDSGVSNGMCAIVPAWYHLWFTSSYQIVYMDVHLATCYLFSKHGDMDLTGKLVVRPSEVPVKGEETRLLAPLPARRLPSPSEKGHHLRDPFIPLFLLEV